MHRILLSGTVLLFLASSAVEAAIAPNFSEAKRRLNIVYNGRQKTFYCDCKYDRHKHKKTPRHETCGYKTRKSETRSNRVEWEHVVPVSKLASNLPCWKIGGRKNCKNDISYNTLANDLYNIVPAIGEINGDRSNFNFGILTGEVRGYGKCDFEVDRKNKVVEPKHDIRGDIARIWLYMSKFHNLKIPQDQLDMFLFWDAKDPPSIGEIIRNERIANLQGNVNPFVLGMIMRDY